MPPWSLRGSSVSQDPTISAQDVYRKWAETGVLPDWEQCAFDPLFEGRSPALAKRCEAVTGRVMFLQDDERRPCAPDLDETKGTWDVVVGSLPKQSCYPRMWAEQSQEDRWALLGLLTASGAYDSALVSAYADKLHKSGNPVYKHLFTCEGALLSTVECGTARDSIGIAAFTRSTVNQQHGTLNPWKGIPGHPDENKECSTRFHGTDHQSVGKLISAVDKARDTPWDFQTADWTTARSSWTKVCEAWEKHKANAKCVGSLPPSQYRDDDDDEFGELKSSLPIDQASGGTGQDDEFGELKSSLPIDQASGGTDQDDEFGPLHSNIGPPEQ